VTHNNDTVKNANIFFIHLIFAQITKFNQLFNKFNTSSRYASLEFGREKVYVITNGMYLNLPTSFVTGEKSGEMLTMVRLDEDAPADSE
jgi:hypothetical protein